VLEKKFRRLKAFGKFFGRMVLFDDARPGKTDERAGLGDVDIAQHGIARSDAAGRGIGEDGNKRQADLIEPRERGGYFRELHQADGALLSCGRRPNRK